MKEEEDEFREESKGNILIRCKVTPYIGEIRGGAGKLMMNLSIALAESGWDVTVLSPQPHIQGGISRPEQPRLHYEEFNYENPTNPVERVIGSVRGKRKFSSIVRDRDIDIIIDNIAHLPFYPGHFNIPSSTKNAVFVHTALFDAARDSSKFYKAPIVEFVDKTLPYLNSPEIICAGPSTEKRIREHLDYRRTHVIHPYADVEDYGFTFDRSSNQVLYLGRLTKRKNIRCLLEAWKVIEEKYSGFELIIAGDGEQRDQLIEYTNGLGLDNVDFPGFVSEERKKELYEESLLFVIPSLQEGYLTSGLEALAAGTPVVGTDTHGINDYIEDGTNGALFERDDSHELAKKISFLLEDPDQIEDIARKGRETAKEHSYNNFKSNADRVMENIVDS